MARVKPVTRIFKTQDEVNEALAELARLDREAKQLELAMNARIDAVKLETTTASAPLNEEKKELEAALQLYAVGHPELFTDKRSLELPHGKLGWRRATSLGTLGKTTWAEVLGNLKSMEFAEAIRTKQEVDKDVLSQWPANKLQIVGVVRKETDAFWYEPKQEELR